ncbi:hypothetical protein WJX72_012236 [[Myrmecia] bisecta]|uniref:DNA polymerase kappa n=1 Tax=[Myrmecia] bisecta TaxID=41462 RepID=A0AAW1PKX5_9CHLO
MSRGPVYLSRHEYKKVQPEDKAKESMHHDGSMAKYMEHKNRKLGEQFAQQAADAAALGPSLQGQEAKLFAGISIHVNGFTTPSHQELKQLMAIHGGNFENYYSRSRVTHIVCSNLPDAKVKQYDRERNPTPVVRPEWVVDSLKAGAVLPIHDYVLWQLREAPGQRSIKAFAEPSPHKSAPSLTASAPAPLEPPPSGPQLQALSRESTPSNALSDSDADELQAADEARVWDADGEWEASDYRPRASDQLNLAKATGSAAEPIAARHDPDARPLTSHAASASDREAQRIAAAARAACDVLKGAPRSSADDPNFMETFFKSSRLHFIGTWKARIEALHATMAVSAPVPQQAMPSVHAESGQRSLFMGSTASRAAERSIIHLDMDCFFASVAALGNPAFEGKPLAVCHSSSAQGTGEVSSANYEARKYGLKAGMFIAEAKRRCPALIVMPYEFDKYEAVSEAVYKILLKYTACVQPISCDEAFLDVTGLGDPEQVAASMRADIQASTGCTASAGIGPNMLVARMATKRGKPNGQFRIPSSAAGDYLNDMEVSDLPGVGWSMARKLESIGIAHVRDVKQRSKAVLQRELGTKSGSMLWNFAHGRDDRPVDPPKARKSVGAEVNWGIRFGSDADSDKFLDELAGEVAARMAAAGVRGRSITLKLKRRKAGAPEPIKFMGHGVCDNLSRSVTLSRFTSAAADLAAEGKAMLRALRVPAQQIRGVGLAVTKLDTDAASLSAKPAGPVPKAAPPPSAYTPADDRGWQEFVTAASPLGKTTGSPVGSDDEAPSLHLDLRIDSDAAGEDDDDGWMHADLTDGWHRQAGDDLGDQDSDQAGDAVDKASEESSQPPVLDPEEQARLAALKGKQPMLEDASDPAAQPPPQAQPLTSVDASVLDALPLAMKRELERAYGVQDLHSPPAKRKRGGGRGTLSRPHKQTTLSSRTTSAAPQQLPAVPALQQPRMHAR